MDMCREGANEREPPWRQPGKQQISSTPLEGFGVAGGVAERRRVGSLPGAGVPREQRGASGGVVAAGAVCCEEQLALQVKEWYRCVSAGLFAAACFTAGLVTLERCMEDAALS